MRYRKTSSTKWRKVIYVSKKDTLVDCWLAEWRYLYIDNIYLHQEWARGNGEIVRHLCGDSRCINPLHLIRGTEFENAYDEIEIRNFTVDYLKRLIKDDSLNEYPYEVQYLVLLPRVQTWYREVKGIKWKLDQIKDIGRDEYRVVKSRKLRESVEDQLLAIIRSKFSWLKNRRDVELYMTEVL